MRDGLRCDARLAATAGLAAFALLAATLLGPAAAGADTPTPQHRPHRHAGLLGGALDTIDSTVGGVVVTVEDTVRTVGTVLAPQRPTKPRPRPPKPPKPPAQPAPAPRPPRHAPADHRPAPDPRPPATQHRRPGPARHAPRTLAPDGHADQPAGRAERRVREQIVHAFGSLGRHVALGLTPLLGSVMMLLVIGVGVMVHRAGRRSPLPREG